MSGGMSSADLELFHRSLEHATASTTGAELDAALADLGWQDAFAVDRRAAVSLLFELQGSANVASSAIDHVIAGALGIDLDGAAVVLPRLGRWGTPGEL